jgi:hypothetical protein
MCGTVAESSTGNTPRVMAADLFDLDQKKKETKHRCSRVVQVPRCGIDCQIAKSCAVSDTHDHNSEAN